MVAKAPPDPSVPMLERQRFELRLRLSISEKQHGVSHGVSSTIETPCDKHRVIDTS